MLGGEGIAAMQGVAPSFAEGQKGGKSKKADDDEKVTTIMLRNIPNKYTRGMLIEQLHRSGYKGDIDYLYLPTDFANRCNVGYCFLNFRTPQARQRFAQAFDGVAAQSCLPGFNSYKVCQVTRAKWQGREENVRRLRSGPELMTQLAQHPEWLPLLIDEEGNQEPFAVNEPGTSPLEPAAGKHSKKYRGKGSGPMDAAGPMDAWMMGMGSFDGFGMGGRGRGMRGRGRRGGQGDSSAYGFAASGMGGGFPMTAMPVPVMTEMGVQYVPYEAAYGMQGGLPYPSMASPQQMFGMPGMSGMGGMYGMADYFGVDGGADLDAFQMPQQARQPRQQRGRGKGGKPAFGDPAQIDLNSSFFEED